MEAAVVPEATRVPEATPKRSVSIRLLLFSFALKKNYLNSSTKLSIVWK